MSVDGLLAKPMHKGWRGLVERLLPWFHPTLERRRDARTDRIVARSERARARAELLIAQYRAADDLARTRAEQLISEIQ